MSYIGNKDYYLEVAKGNIPGSKIKSKFGKNPAVGVAEFEAVTHNGGSYSGFNATAAETVTIVSNSTLDDVGGTGLQTIRIYGLDANGLEQNEDIVLTGTIPVTSTLSYLRLDTARGLTAGALEHNQGDITIAQSITTSVVFAVVPAQYNSTMIAAYTIPFDKTGFVVSQSAAIANKNAAAVGIRFQVRSPGNVFTVGGEAALNSVGTGYVNQTFTIPKILPAGTDIFIEAIASAEVAVSAFLDILLVDN